LNASAQECDLVSYDEQGGIEAGRSLSVQEFHQEIGGKKPQKAAGHRRKTRKVDQVV
jgi:hypothetical protein